MPDNWDRDPGDAVAPGVAAKYPPPQTKRDREVEQKLEHLGEQPSAPGKATGPEHQDVDKREE